MYAIRSYYVPEPIPRLHGNCQRSPWSIRRRVIACTRSEAVSRPVRSPKSGPSGPADGLRRQAYPTKALDLTFIGTAQNTPFLLNTYRILPISHPRPYSLHYPPRTNPRAPEEHPAAARVVRPNRGARNGDNSRITSYNVCYTKLLRFCTGDDLRIIVIGGRVVAGAVRRPAMVKGNGKSTIAALIEAQSRRRGAATGGESKIPMDAETERFV